MSVAWAINGTSFEAAGIQSASVTFRAGAPSEMRLQLARNYDASALLGYGTAATITRGGTAFFRGSAATNPRSASGTAEGQELVLVDAWQQMEDTIYQEPWAVGSGSVDLPIAVLGVDPSTGARITTAQQITAAITYAAAAGIDIQMGSVPTGMPLWPTEVRNVSIAEVIRLSTRFHPDWIPWIDHSSGPPTFNVTARSAATARALSVTALDGVDIVRRDDLKPDAVRIVYLNATIIDGVTYRDGIIDKYPSGGPDAGPRVLSQVIELAGGQMQFQKSRIQTRALPDSQETAKAWLKKKFPHLKDVDDAHFAVNGWEKELIEDDDDHADPINPRAERLEVTDVDDLPRELVRGQIEDWMRKKVGRVRVTATIRPAAGATAAEKAAIRKGTPPVTVTATNATTKIYKGVTQWTAPEDAPAGIAQKIYDALASYQFEGSVTLTEEDVAATRYHGCKLNLTDGLGDWTSMGASIHSVTHDIGSGRTRLGIGPAPYLSADDFLELQRLFRGRPVTWMSDAERTSNELGAQDDPGSKGDTVSGYDIPESFQDPGTASAFPPFYPRTFVNEGGTWKAEIEPGYLEYQNIAAAAATMDVLGYVVPKIGGASIEDGPLLSLPGLTSFVYLKVPTNSRGLPTAASVEIVATAEAQTSTHHLPPAPGVTARNGEYYFLLFQTVSDGETPASPSIVRALPGNKQMPNQLIEIEQVGGEVELLKAYVEAADKYELRTLKALEGGSGGVSVLQVLEEPVDTVNFKWVGPGGSPIQINVEASGDEGIIVKGNGASGIFNFLDCDNMPVVSFEVADGMITSPSGGDAILGDCGGGGDPETTTSL